MFHPWLGIVLVLALLLGVMAALKAHARRYAPHPEWTRKLLHMSMGLATLSFPWLFREVWPVLVLAVFSCAYFVLLRASGPLQRHLGGVLDGVKRDAPGEIYFALAIAMLFVLARGDAVLFAIPVLLLTFADAVCALIGVRYGRLRYPIGEDEKSAEGSVAFFAVAFGCAHAPLLLWTQTGRAETLLIALTLALLMTFVEAASWRGLDNLFIPLGAFALLKNFLRMDATALCMHLGVALALVVFGLWVRRRTALDESAALSAALIGYIGWAVGGGRWLLPLLALFCGYILSSRRAGRNSRSVPVQGVLCVASASLVWLLLANALDAPQLFYPYTLALAAHLALTGIAALRHFHPWLRDGAIAAFCVLASWILLFVPFLLLQGLDASSLKQTLYALGFVALAALLFCAMQRSPQPGPTDTARWLRQAAVAAAISVLSLIAL